MGLVVLILIALLIVLQQKMKLIDIVVHVRLQSSKNIVFPTRFWCDKSQLEVSAAGNLAHPL